MPTFEQINEMIARNPEELDLFQKMDQEMFAKEGKEKRLQEILEKKPSLKDKDLSKINYRLVQDWEVPEWVKVKP